MKKNKYILKHSICLIMTVIFIVVNNTIGFIFNNQVNAAEQQTVIFSNSSSQSQSQTITIYNLKSITGISVNTGYVNYSMNGDNVTINVGGGSSVASSTSSDYRTDSRTSTTNSFPDSIPYDKDGYSGSLSKSGDSTITSGSDADSKPYTGDSDTGNITNKYIYAGDYLGWEPESSTQYNPSDKPYKQDSEGYEGTLKPSTVFGKAIGSAPDNPHAGDTYTTTTPYTTTYSGTITRPDTRNWQQDYGGTVYGSTTYYYAYNVTINYTKKGEITITPKSPSQNQVVSNNQPCTPEIGLKGDDGNTLNYQYSIDSNAPSDTGSVSNASIEQDIRFKNIDISSLSDGGHTIKFYATDGTFSKDASINFIVDKTPPSISINPVSTDTSITVVGNANDPVSGLYNTPYRYTIGESTSDWCNSSSYCKSGLVPNTEYSVKVEARDNGLNKGEDDKKIYTKAQQPSCSVSGLSSSALKISVSDTNPACTYYQIQNIDGRYVNSSGELIGSPEWINIPTKNINVNQLDANTLYKFRVKAKNSENVETDFSQWNGGVTLANPPEIKSTECTQTSISLSWSPVTGAKSYELEMDEIKGTNVNGTAYTHSGLTADTQHKYRIRVLNDGGWSEWSSMPFYKKTLPNPPDTPVNIGTALTNKSITLNWEPTARAENYEIEITYPDGRINTITEYNNQVYGKQVYEHKELKADTQYSYKVRAVNEGGNSSWSTPVITKTYPDPPLTPSNIIVKELSQYYLTLSWNTADRAAEYKIKFGSGVNSTVVSAGNQTTYTFTNLQADTAYTYQIMAKNAGGESEWSNQQTITTLPIPPVTPTNITAISDKDKITVTWDKVLYATDYVIELDGVETKVGDNCVYMHSGLGSNSKHTYRIKAENRGGISEWSAPITTYTMPEPTGDVSGLDNDIQANVAAIAKNSSITLSWGNIEGATEYEIEVDGQVKGNGSNTMFTHNGLIPNTQHTYRIRGKNQEGTGNWCAVLLISTLPLPPDAPANLKAVRDNDKIELTWDPAKGATGYELEVDGNVVDNKMLTTYTHMGLQGGTEHTYRIRATNLGGKTMWSPVLKVSTLNPMVTVQCKKGAEFNVALTGENVQDFNRRSFTVTYNPDELEVVDLCDITPEKDVISDGLIAGTNLSVQYEPGKITFTSSLPVLSGDSWTGVINNIVFRSKIDGETNIAYENK